MPSRNPGPFMLKKQEAAKASERRLLLEYLKAASFNVSAAAEKAGMFRSAFQRLIRKNELDVPQLRRDWRAQMQAKAATEAS
jgi:transcriptional regulator with GAF, ATPase, and Fis domain